MRACSLTTGLMAGACVTLALPQLTLAQTPVAAPEAAAPRSGSNATELFRTELPDMPGKQLVVVSLRFAPGNSPKGRPHQHPGSVFVYVTKGEARLGIEGQPPKVVPTGQGFFEPIGGVHNVSESTSPTEAATGIAFMIVPDGAPLVTTVPAEHAGH
jgi:quercetin dioxygenase-like cupin family protein